MAWRKTPEDRSRDAVTYGAPWRRARKRQLELVPVCQLALEGCTGRATQVDHIHGAAADPHHRHLRSACEPCHRKVTAQQGGGYRKPRGTADPPSVQRTRW